MPPRFEVGEGLYHRRRRGGEEGKRWSMGRGRSGFARTGREGEGSVAQRRER